jgi:hypothetical protein
MTYIAHTATAPAACRRPHKTRSGRDTKPLYVVRGTWYAVRRTQHARTQYDRSVLPRPSLETE